MTSREEEIQALRARLAELEAMPASPPTPPPAPPPAPPLAPRAAPMGGGSFDEPDRAPVILGLITVVATVLMIGAWIWVRSADVGTRQAERPPAKDPVAEAQAASAAADKAAAEALAQIEGPQGWTYSDDKDDMTDKPIRLACVTSENEVKLDWPYHPVRARLCLRNHPQYGQDAYVSLMGDGQILCQSYEPCTVQVRFDDGAPQPFSAIGPSDNSSNFVFIRNRKRLEAAIAGAEETRVQIEFYEAGSQTVTFLTKGFAWPAETAP